MAIPKLMLFFKGYGQAWTETYFARNEVDNETLLRDAASLVTLRAQMLAVGYTLTIMRASQDDVDLDSAVNVPFASPVRVLKGAGPGGQDIRYIGAYSPPLEKYAAAHPNYAVQVRCDAGDLYRKTRDICGVPLLAVQEPFDETFSHISEWATALYMYLNELKSGTWALKVRSKDQVSTGASPITQAFSNPAGEITVFVKDPQDIPSAPTKVNITRAKMDLGSPLINGIHKVEWVTSVSFKISDQHAQIVYIDGGSVRAHEFSLVTIDRVGVVGISSKKRGVLPYSPPRGRSRKPRTKKSSTPAAASWITSAPPTGGSAASSGIPTPS